MISNWLNQWRRPPDRTRMAHIDVTPHSAPAAVMDVTDADFADVVLASTIPVVVDLWAEWCAPCGTISAFVGFLAEEYAGRLLVVALDVDENPATSDQYGVLGLPTLLFIRNGVEVDRQVGLLTYPELQRKAEQLLVG